jgi:hypothetical protein
MFEPIDGLGERTVAVRAVGKVSGDDYQRVLVPAVEAATAGGHKARLYIELGDGFQGYEAGGVAADAALGLGHLGSFERMAVVTDEHWIRDAVGLFGALIPGEIKVYPTTDAAAAREWIAA